MFISLRWSHLGLNQGLPDYESGALTNWAIGPDELPNGLPLMCVLTHKTLAEEALLALSWCKGNAFFRYMDWLNSLTHMHWGVHLRHHQGNQTIPQWRFWIIQWGMKKIFGTLISFFRSFTSLFRSFISALRGKQKISTEVLWISSVETRS